MRLNEELWEEEVVGRSRIMEMGGEMEREEGFLKWGEEGLG